jgi:hypothetical protein
VTGWGSYSFLFGPLMGLIGVGLLLGVSRWMSGGSGSVMLPPPSPAPPEGYGLMVPVADPRGSQEALELCRILADAGVRSQAVMTSEGLRVMVWAQDVGRARTLLDSAC